ncbi:MAG TPA: tRNA (adenosine(37)-N6)-threonylcarbamoyltransferase complex dimerization subunit type 1 TsaB [Candidatus Eisenbacteria bacterium]|nr:tRNA (adenosine(37)-N6)-threonylcarbamoyltransferase complex dimerization subunit type 1 TsaB [Candidatus Eisenbacteria bacterium]
MRSILGIDTASPRGSVALLVDGTLRGRADLEPGGHSSGLAAAAEALARDAGLALSGLSGIAVSRGPGSFTGLRIGLAWAKGVAFASGVPLVLVSAHEAAARAARDASDRARITVTTGERKEVQVALWAAPGAEEARGARPEAIEGPVSVPEADAADRVRELAGARPYVVLPANDAIRTLLEEEDVACAPPAPLAAAVAEVGGALLLAGAADDLASASPDYGRAPNARKPAP